MRWIVLIVVLAGCATGSGPRPSPREPKHQEWADEGPDTFDHPESTVRPAKAPRDPVDPYLPRSGDAARPNVKVELTVVDVISWEDVKIRGGIRGSVVRGVVSLTGWLSTRGEKGKSARRTSSFLVVQTGREASIELSDAAVRDLVGPYAALRVAVLEANDKGEVEVAVTPLVAPTADGSTMTLATRCRVSSGEALVVGGYKSEEDERAPGDNSAKKRDSLVIITATVVR